MNQPLRIVVLGGTGFVGSHLVPHLANAGHRITVLSRNRERHRDLAVLPGSAVLSRNVYDPTALAHAFAGADAVINLVGILNEKGYDGSGFRRAHVDLTRIVIDAMGRAGVRRLLQMSALRTGDGGQSWYLKTRAEAEALVRASTLDWTIFRPGVIFGPGDGLFNRFRQLLALAPVLPLARAGTKFAPVYVRDVAEAFSRALVDPATIGETYEIYGPDVMTLAEIVRYTARHAGMKRGVIGLPDALGWAQAATMGAVFGLIPFVEKPLSTDNFKSLALDSVGKVDGLKRLGITPTPVDAIVPDMLSGKLGKQDELDAYRRRRS
jgi:NADH dehydrogenase